MDKFLIKKKRKADCEANEDSQKNIKLEQISVPENHPLIKLRKEITWRNVKAENLNCNYSLFFEDSCATRILNSCEKSIVYFDGDLAKVQIFGKWFDIPRKQAAYGDPGLKYTFSNNTIPAKPWLPFLTEIKEVLEEQTQSVFNFVLVNRYKDGNDNMGYHKDDEKDLVKGSSIASLSFGEKRDFLFKHGDTRGKDAKRQIPNVSMELEHGSLLIMKPPTNDYWYHSLPVRKKVPGLRINMTFRYMVKK